MKKGRFYRNIIEDKFMISDNVLGINCKSSTSSLALETDQFYKPQDAEEITDFVNDICFEILKCFGYEYIEDQNIFRSVIYLSDINIVPGEKFIGIKINHLEGTESTWYDMFPNIEMNLDILSSFRFDLGGYIGIRNSYRICLLYTDENLKIYQDYIKYSIETRHEGNFWKDFERKIKT